MQRIAFDTFTVMAPLGWVDITDTVEADNPPFTLAHSDGVGALQFTIALYSSGVEPHVKPADLLEMLQEFGSKDGLEAPSEVVNEIGPPMVAAGNFAWEADFLRVWQVSDGRNSAFVTYTCSGREAGSDLPPCEQIVRSIEFKQAVK